MIHFEASILFICVENFLIWMSLFSSSEICSGFFFEMVVTVLAAFSGLGGAFYIFPNRKMIGKNIRIVMSYFKITFRLCPLLMIIVSYLHFFPFRRQISQFFFHSA